MSLPTEGIPASIRERSYASSSTAFPPTDAINSSKEPNMSFGISSRTDSFIQCDSFTTATLFGIRMSGYFQDSEPGDWDQQRTCSQSPDAMLILASSIMINRPPHRGTWWADLR